MLKPHVHNFLNIFCWFKAWWFQVALLSRILYPRSLVWYWTGDFLYLGEQERNGAPEDSSMFPNARQVAGALRCSWAAIALIFAAAAVFSALCRRILAGSCVSIWQVLSFVSSWAFLIFLMSLSPPHWIIFARKFYSRGGANVPASETRKNEEVFAWNILEPYASGAWPHSFAGGMAAYGSSNGHTASLVGGFPVWPCKSHDM